MTIADARSLQRFARRLVVEARQGVGSPPMFEPAWQPVWGAHVDRVEINRDGRPSSAVVWFSDLRWDSPNGLGWGDMVRIRTDEPSSSQQTILFVGYIVRFRPEFAGGDLQTKAYERNCFVALDHRWLLATGVPLHGQIARGPDDYIIWDPYYPVPRDNWWTFFSGRRAIFNPDGKPNLDPYYLVLQNSAGVKLCEVPIFTDASDNSLRAASWTAGEMMRYILCPLWNSVYDYLPISNPAALVGLDHSDWTRVLNHIVIEGLSVAEAVDLICKHLGWGWREEYFNDGAVPFVFFKLTPPTAYVRSTAEPTIRHWLHAPAVGETIAAPVAAGKKLLWSAQLDMDISSVVNNPWGIGSPDRFEFSAQLVPAWQDADLAPDLTGEKANLFFTEADLQDLTDPNAKTYYRYYHPRGSQFRRNVGRKWALNEAGLYTISPYDRGQPFEFSAVIPKKYILDGAGYRLFGRFNRRFLLCLTKDKDGLNSVGIVVQFSFDGGATWQTIPASVISLADECGVHITEPNLAELVDQHAATITGGDLDGVQLNYWTSLCRDRLAGGAFKYGQWATRVRVTASVQMDQRIVEESLPSPASGSPFWQSRLYDFSEKYGLVKRASSIYYGGDLAAVSVDSTSVLYRHLDAIRRENEDMSLSGLFTLERLWLGDGAGLPDFMIGDCIEKITGREFPLSASFGGGEVYPQVVQIVYLPHQQKMQLVTRDLRFSKVSL